MAILEHDGHPLHGVLHISGLPLMPKCSTECLRKTFVPTAVRLVTVFFFLSFIDRTITKWIVHPYCDVHHCKRHHCRFCVLLGNVYVCLLYIVLLGAVYCGSSLYVSLMWPSEPSVFICVGDRFSLAINKASRPNRTSIS